MSIFQDVMITWDGEEYKIPSNKVMEAIDRIEDVIRFQHFADGNYKINSLAKAYSAALDVAGCKVSSEEVYASFFSNEEASQNAATVSASLMMLMLPPSALTENAEPVDAKKKPEAEEAKAD